MRVNYSSRIEEKQKKDGIQRRKRMFVSRSERNIFNSKL